MTALHPLTIVRPPILTLLRPLFRPSTSRKTLSYIYHLTRINLTTVLSNIAMYLSSSPRWFPYPKPRYHPQWRKSAPQAKDLHARMNTAIARGDVETLQKICVASLSSKLQGVVTARKRAEAAAHLKAVGRKGKNLAGAQLRWQALSYKSTPKVVSKTTFPMPAPPNFSRTSFPWIQQAVVKIACVQQLAKWAPPPPSTVDRGKSKPHSQKNHKKEGVAKAADWTLVPGTAKVHTATEYIVMQRHIDPNSWAVIGDWKIWGTVSETDQKEMEKVLSLEKVQKGMAKSEMKKKWGSALPGEQAVAGKS